MMAGAFGGWNRNESGAGMVIPQGGTKIRAMQIISELGGTTRGPYAGCVRFFQLQRQCEFYLGNRVLLVLISHACRTASCH